MKIALVGAAGGEVTGSCYRVQAKQARILVDCGLFQGGKKSEALNRPPTALLPELFNSGIGCHRNCRRWATSSNFEN